MSEKEFDYKPQATDLTKFGENYSKAFGKGENKLVDCDRCGSRHWTHQSCKPSQQKHNE